MKPEDICADCAKDLTDQRAETMEGPSGFSVCEECLNEYMERQLEQERLQYWGAKDRSCEDYHEWRDKKNES